jgi:hypothetical protein
VRRAHPVPQPLAYPAERTLHAHNYAPPHALPSELSPTHHGVGEGRVLSVRLFSFAAPVPDLAVVGFTARLYFSLIHGCIPVYVDLFPRTLTFEELAFPFPRSVRYNPATASPAPAHTPPRRNARHTPAPQRQRRPILRYVSACACSCTVT